MEKKYFVRQDLQGGEFGMYREYTIQEWREQAMDWADMDDHEGLYQTLETLEKDKVIEFISNFWELDIVECPKIGFEMVCRKTIDSFNLMDIVVVDGKIIQGTFSDDETANKYKGKMPQDMQSVLEIFGNNKNEYGEYTDFGTFKTWIELYEYVVKGLIRDDLNDLGIDDFYLDTDTLKQLGLIEQTKNYYLGADAKKSIISHLNNHLELVQGGNGNYYTLTELQHFIEELTDLKRKIIQRQDYEVKYE